MTSTTRRTDLISAHAARVLRRSLLYIVLGWAAHWCSFPLSGWR